MLLDFAEVPLIIHIHSRCGRVRAEVHVEIIDNVGKEFQLYDIEINTISRGENIRMIAIRDGSLISSPCGVPTSVNFFPGTSLRSCLQEAVRMSVVLHSP